MEEGATLTDASRRLEEAFFARESAAAARTLRVRTEEELRRESLAEIVAIHDERFLDRLVALSVTPETAVSLVLTPLIVVAWADGQIDERERKAILDAVDKRGVATGEIARKLLRSALDRKPDPRLFENWKSYVSRLWGCFTADERLRMRKNLLDSTRGVAEAAGGFLGLARISDAEQSVLRQIEQLLD